jgi:hypothetical protein
MFERSNSNSIQRLKASKSIWAEGVIKIKTIKLQLLGQMQPMVMSFQLQSCISLLVVLTFIMFAQSSAQKYYSFLVHYSHFLLKATVFANVKDVYKNVLHFIRQVTTHVVNLVDFWTVQLTLAKTVTVDMFLWAADLIITFLYWLEYIYRYVVALLLLCFWKLWFLHFLFCMM